MSPLTHQFIESKQTQTFILTEIYIQNCKERKQQLTCNSKEQFRICSNKRLQDKELDLIKHNPCDVNNYPRKLVQHIIDYNLY